MNFSIYRFDEISSTNDMALQKASEGSPDGSVFVAESQTAGRGRMGRSWESPQGKNLYASILLRPTCSPGQAHLLTLVTGTALFDTFNAYLPSSDRLKIKWPNDLYWEDRKIAGILSEMKSQKNRIDHVIIGLGVNLNSNAEDFSPDVRDTATSMKIILEKDTDRKEFLNRFLSAFEKRYENFLSNGPFEILDFCDRHSYLKGKKVQWKDGETKTGIVLGLNAEGLLHIQMQDGMESLVIAEDVHLSRFAPAKPVASPQSRG